MTQLAWTIVMSSTDHCTVSRSQTQSKRDLSLSFDQCLMKECAQATTLVLHGTLPRRSPWRSAASSLTPKPVHSPLRHLERTDKLDHVWLRTPLQLFFTRHLANSRRRQHGTQVIATLMIFSVLQSFLLTHAYRKRSFSQKNSWTNQKRFHAHVLPKLRFDFGEASRLPTG